MNRSSGRAATQAWASMLSAAITLAACGDGDGRAKTDAARPIVAEDPVDNVCDGKPDGEMCGEGDERHCVGELCVINICGDGVVAGLEACDDGNQEDDDDCTPSCHRPRGTCGDGHVDPGEECDDGNTSDSDFCSSACLRQLCRNGVLDPNEECDDGNTDPRDGCNNECQKIVCGDGKAEEQEECDDGNASDADACSNKCTANICGNERIDPGEACDKGRIKSASGKPEGDPIPEGEDCAPDCKSVVMDRCKKCAEAKCRSYTNVGGGEVGDAFAGCYQVGFVDPQFPDRPPTDSAWVAKCSALTECARRNRCDLVIPWTPERPTYDVNTGTDYGLLWGGCFCGEVMPGSGTWDLQQTNCYVTPGGKCVKQWYDATSCSDGYCTESYSIDGTVPSYYASMVTECQQTYCRKECR